ncbi:hypothetical protein GTO89_08835 [Heliobacterium gestii]|uniref:Fibronectin type-III domain-containing protein n=1 Tax=Heliomicrobium gestii TaxID=2699 RepID=A0A845LDY3_HELGE|nr:IPT/TIG domain-containing protein [Heliomicrobium gestii]MBM7866580.1 hypothetical protein [Heliomicrobium gestii]MZP43140.1 hypothetical protein [Heliomicrobium gestii]
MTQTRRKKRIGATLTLLLFLMQIFSAPGLFLPKAEAATFAIQSIDYSYGDGLTRQMIIRANQSLEGATVDIGGGQFTFPKITGTSSTVTLDLPSGLTSGQKYDLTVTKGTGDFVTVKNAIDMDTPFSITNMIGSYNIDVSNPDTRQIVGSNFKTDPDTTYIINAGDSPPKTATVIDSTKIEFPVPVTTKFGSYSAYLREENKIAKGTSELTGQATSVEINRYYQKVFGPLNFWPGGTPNLPTIHSVENLFPYAPTDGSAPQKQWGSADPDDLFDQTGQKGYLIKITGLNFKTASGTQDMEAYINGTKYPIEKYESTGTQQSIQVRLTGLNLVNQTGFTAVSIGVRNTDGFLSVEPQAFWLVKNPYQLRIEGTDSQAYIDGRGTDGNPKEIVIYDDGYKFDQDQFDGASRTVSGLPSYPQVRFGPSNTSNSSSTVTLEGKNKLRVKVPPGPAGSWELKVITRYGTSTYKYFTYLPYQSVPTLSGFVDDPDSTATPAKLAQTKRDTPFKTYLRGTDFYSSANGTPPQVFVGDQALPAGSVKYINPKTLEVTFPTWTEPGTYRIKVHNADGGETKEQDVQFTYLSLPKISKPEPSKIGSKGGNIVRLYGQDFMKGIHILINDKAGINNYAVPDTVVDNVYSIQWNSPTELFFHLPDSLPAGTLTPTDDGFITITNPDGESYTYKDGFFIRDPQRSPQIDSVVPSKSPRGGNIEVIITGKDFDEDAVVYFANTPVSGPGKVTRVSDKELHVIVPAVKEIYPFLDDNTNIGIPIPIRVMNIWDASASPPYMGFQYKNTSSTPKADTLQPSVGSVTGGTYVVILGSGFIPGTGNDGRAGSDGNTVDNTVVYFGSQEVKAHRVSANLIEVFTPPAPYGQPGTVDVRVMNPDGATTLLKSAYTYKMVDSYPRIDSVTPRYGPTTGGTEITVKVSDYRDGGKIFIGGKEATLIQVLPTSDDPDPSNGAAYKNVYVRTPAHTAGWKRVVVSNPDGGSGFTEADGYLYVAPGSTPTITSVTPNSGATTGGITVVIKGTDFRDTIRNDTSAPITFQTIEGAKTLTPGSTITVLPQVTFGGVPATSVKKLNEQTIEAVVPVNSTGTKDVTLTNWDFGTATLKNGFTYVGTNPGINSISPCGADVDDPTRPVVYIDATDLVYDGTGFIVRFGESNRPAGTGPYDVTKTRIGEDANGNAVAGTGIQVVTYDSTTRRGVYRVTVPLLSKLFNYYDANDPNNRIQIHIFNPDGQEKVWSGKFRMFNDEQGPVINSIEPASGSAIGGTPVRIKMTNLLIDWNKKEQWPYFVFGGIRVMPNNANTAINYPADPNKDLSNEPVRLITPGNSSTDQWEWEVVLPAYPWPTDAAWRDKNEFPVQVMAVNRLDCTSGVAAEPFIYTKPKGGLDLVGITPDRAPTDGNLPAVITAAINANSKGFVQEGGTPRVLFGTVEATVTNVTPKELSILIPPHEVGKVDITVINPDGSEGHLYQKFTYTTMPLIESIKPNAGPVSGGTEVVINGRGFVTGAKVTFGTAAATVLSAEDSVIRVKTPPGPAISGDTTKAVVDVTVTNPDGNSHTLTNGFTYYKDEGLPEEAPVIIAKAVSKDTIRVSWPAVNMAKAYEVEVSEGERGNYRLYENISTDHKQGDQLYSLVKGLIPKTKYWFRVRAISSLGAGPYSEEVSATTTDEGGFDGFGQSDSEIVTTPQGAKLILRKKVEKYYDLRSGAMGAAKTKAVSFTPDAQGYANPVLLDSGEWKVLIPPLAIRYNAGNMTDSQGTVQVGPAPAEQAERALLSNRFRRPISKVYEIQLIYEKDKDAFAPAYFNQALSLTLNYQAPPAGKMPSLYYYDGMSRTWTRVEAFVDPVAVSAAVNRAGYYAVFAD